MLLLKTVELCKLQLKLEVTNPLSNTKIVIGYGPVGKGAELKNIETFVRDGSDKVSTLLEKLNIKHFPTIKVYRYQLPNNFHFDMS